MVINWHNRSSDWYLTVVFATPREKANDPPGGRDPQVENHCSLPQQTVVDRANVYFFKIINHVIKKFKIDEL